MARLRHLATLFATTLALLSSQGASADPNNNVTARFEIDLIFPRNETYKVSEIFPIALVVQNYTAIQSLGRSFMFYWSIMPYREGRIPGGISYDMDYFDEVENPQDPVLLVANTNISAWIHNKEPDQQYNLRWGVHWNVSDDCGIGAAYKSDSMMFSVETEWDVRNSENGTSIGKEADLFDLPECPQLGSLVDLRPNTTEPDCPLVLDAKEGGDEGNPCAVKIDEAFASDIVVRAESAATSSILETSWTLRPLPTPTNAGFIQGPRPLLAVTFITVYTLELLV